MRASGLDQYLASQIAEVSRARVQQLIERGEVLVNDAAARPRCACEAMSGSPLQPRPMPRRCARWRRRLRSTLFTKMTNLAVVNKPAGMMVHAGAGATDDARNRGTLVNALLHHFQTLSGVGGELRPGLCIGWIARPAG